MYAWERPFTKLVTIARRLELNIVLKNSYLRGLHMTFMLFTTRMAIFCTMLSAALLYGAGYITASRVFVALINFHILSVTVSQSFVRSLVGIAEISVSIKRSQQFLKHDEKPELERTYESDETSIDDEANDVCNELMYDAYIF